MTGRGEGVAEDAASAADEASWAGLWKWLWIGEGLGSGWWFGCPPEPERCLVFLPEKK